MNRPLNGQRFGAVGVNQGTPQGKDNMMLARDRFLCHAAVLGTLLLATPTVMAEEASHPFGPMLEHSMEKRVGLIFYMNGQTLAGLVIEFIDERTVAVRNQQYSRIVIRLDRVDAVARY